MPTARIAAHLTPDQAESVRRIAAAAHRADGVAPLSEQFLLDLTGPTGHVTHVLTDSADRAGQEKARPVGYAQLTRDGSAELVVDPDHRRAGHGAALLSALLEASPDLRVWAHGRTEGARALAASRGLVVVRELHKMSRALTGTDRGPVSLPEGFAARPFRPGADEDAWVGVNAAAFADHPEQGSVDRDGLAERMRQPWFDPEDLILVEDVRAEPVLAAFHWTKIDPAQVSSTHPDRTAGEVYVLGVHPAYQGRGLAGPVTALGLAHLADRGLPEVVLYVDGDNVPALRTYERSGFTVSTTDVMYAPPHPA